MGVYNRNMVITKSTPFLAIATFILTRAFMLIAFEPYLTDVRFYFHVAESALKQGLTAYESIFYGYPPLSLTTIYLPYWLSNKFESYRVWYQLTNVAFDAVTFYYLSKFMRERLELPVSHVLRGLVLYCVLSVFHAHYIYDRVDLFIVMTFVMALYYLTRSESYKASIAASLGILWKVIPVIWLPVVVLFKTRLHHLRGLAISALTATLPTTLFLYIYDKRVEGALVKALTLHSDRGIQIESLWATPFMILRAFDLSDFIGVANNHGAQHLLGVPAAIVAASKFFGFAVLGLFFLHLTWVLFKKFKNTEELNKVQLPAFGFFAISMPIVLFLATQRVLSTTFMIWLLPIVAVLWALKPDLKFVAIPFLMSLLTYIGFDVGYWDFAKFDPFYVSVYAIRNILLAVFTAFFIRQYLRFIELPVIHYDKARPAEWSARGKSARGRRSGRHGG